MGPGLTTRKNCEFLIIGKRGRPERLATDVHEVVLARVREHSRKPDEAYSRIERYCAGPRLELFARESRLGWTPWGDEAAKFDQPDNAAGDPIGLHQTYLDPEESREWTPPDGANAKKIRGHPKGGLIRLASSATGSRSAKASR